MLGPRLSPDGQRLAYHTTANNKNEIWVRPLGETGELGVPVRVGDGLGMTAWRADGSELYYAGPKREFMAASVRTSPTLAIGAPRRLFDLPDAIPVAAGFDGRGDVSSDGSAVVLAVPPRIPPLPQTEMRVVDRTGKVVATPGEAGNFFGRPMISPDGTKVAAGITKPLDDVFELWVFDLEADTGKLTLRRPQRQFLDLVRGRQRAHLRLPGLQQRRGRRHFPASGRRLGNARAPVPVLPRHGLQSHRLVGRRSLRSVHVGRRAECGTGSIGNRASPSS